MMVEARLWEGGAAASWKLLLLLPLLRARVKRPFVFPVTYPTQGIGS